MRVIRQVLHNHYENAVAIAPTPASPCPPGTLVQRLRTAPLTTRLTLLGVAGITLVWGVGSWLTGIVAVVKGMPAAPAVTRAPQRWQPTPPPATPVRSERPAAAILAQPPATTRPVASPRTLPSVVPLPAPSPGTNFPAQQPSVQGAPTTQRVIAEFEPAAVPAEAPTPTVVPPLALAVPPGMAAPGPAKGTAFAVASMASATVVPAVEPAPRQSSPVLLPLPPEEQLVAPKLPVTETAAPPTLNYFKEAERAYREGLAAYQANRTDASLVALQLALGFYPGHLPARELLADQLELRGEIDASLALLQEGLTIAADHTALRKRAARILLDRGEKAAAAQMLIGTGLVPIRTDPELHWLLANTYQQLGEYQLAARTYRNLLAQEPGNGSLWFNLGSALEAGGEREEAGRAYQQALKLGGLDRKMTAWAREVTATASPAAVAAPSTPALNHFKEAERAYQEGLAAYQANRTEASLVALQLALGFYPGHLPARELLADQLELHGDTSAALALLADGLAIAPDHSAFRKRAARLFADRGELAKAAQVLVGPGLAPVRTDPELHRLLAATYRQLGEHFLAAQTYRNLLVHDRRNGTLWVNLGGALDANGQRDEARQAYQKALTVGGLDREGYAQARAGVNM